jgi:hypothetical protein
MVRTHDPVRKYENPLVVSNGVTVSVLVGRLSVTIVAPSPGPEV